MPPSLKRILSYALCGLVIAAVAYAVYFFASRFGIHFPAGTSSQNHLQYIPPQ